MVENFKKILKKMIDDRGDIYLLALLKMDDLADKWTVILSAPWAQEGDSDIFKYVLNQLKSNLASEELTNIARLGIVPKEDHLVSLLMRFNSETPLKNEKVNGNLIHEGYIVLSNKNAEETTRQGKMLTK